MKKVLILDKDNATLRSLLESLQRYSDLEVIVANEREYIQCGLQQLSIDLVLTDIEGTENCCFELIESINQHFPALAVDIISAPLPADLESRLGKLRVAKRFSKPLNAQEAAKSIHQQLTSGAVGQLKGLSLTSVLQLMNIERKNCVLTVHTVSNHGELYIQEGEIVAARTGAQRGKDAAYNIISWENVRIDFQDEPHGGGREIFEPFMALVMEALRLKDEMKLPALPPEKEVKEHVLGTPVPGNGENGQQQSAPVTLIEKQILAFLDPFPGITQYSLYDKNNNLRFSRSRYAQPVITLQPELFHGTMEVVARILNAGSFKHMVINEKNGPRHVFFTFQGCTVLVGLRREQSVSHFLQQVKTNFEVSAQS